MVRTTCFKMMTAVNGVFALVVVLLIDCGLKMNKEDDDDSRQWLMKKERGSFSMPGDVHEEDDGS